VIDIAIASLLTAFLAAAGYRTGLFRFAGLLAALAIGGAAAAALGPIAHAGLAAVTGWDSWAAWGLTMAAVYAAASCAAVRLLRARERKPAGRRERIAGLAAGLALGLGFLALVCLTRAAAPTFEPVAWVQKPFLYVRAVRVLRDVSPEEARWVADRPEVRAVAESGPLRRLMEDPDVLRRVQQASAGSRIALAALAADPKVKAAMEEPEFLDRVRRVDLPALAEAVTARRAGAARALPVRAPEDVGRESGAWRLGYALGARLRDGARSTRSSDRPDASEPPTEPR
jgi:hypothetical protein